MQYSGHNTPLGHHTDRGPMGLGEYNSLGKYCGPHTSSSVYILLFFLTEFGGPPKGAEGFQGRIQDFGNGGGSGNC